MSGKVFAIVGSGRSGTSAIAKGLQLAGIPMGDPVLPANFANPEGYYEHRELVELNDKILDSLEAAWDRPPSWSFVESRSYRHVSRCVRYIISRGDPPWGMKDPRLTLLWPIWRDAFEKFDHDLIVIQPWRDRDRIAKSLVEMGACFETDARSLAVAYQVRMERIAKEQAP